MHGNQRQKRCPYSYIAGLIDGEGSLMFSKSIHGFKGYAVRKNPIYSPRIRIQMTTREPLDFILESTGLGKIIDNGIRKSRPNRRGIFGWEVHSSTVGKFLDLIEDYLILKVPQAKLMREFFDRVKWVKFCRGGIPPEELAFREDVYQRMRKLNERGLAATTKSQSTGDGEAIV